MGGDGANAWTFCYRFNRRNIPRLIFDKRIDSALVTPPLGYYRRDDA
jgi:hypothetical protein